MRQSVIENSIGYRPVCAAGGVKIGRATEMSSFGRPVEPRGRASGGLSATTSSFDKLRMRSTGDSLVGIHTPPHRHCPACPGNPCCSVCGAMDHPDKPGDDDGGWVGSTEIDSADASTALIPVQNYPRYRFFKRALKKSAFSGSPVARVIRSGVDQREPWLQILSERH